MRDIYDHPDVRLAQRRRPPAEPRDNAERVCDLLITAAPAALQASRFQVGCIAATRAALAFCEGMEVPARAVSVSTAVFNHGFLKASTAEQLAAMPEVPRALYDRWHEQYGAWSVGIGLGPDRQQAGQWHGHLALLVDERYLVDITIQQATREQHGIQLCPFSTPVSTGFIEATEPLALMLYFSLLLYTHRPENDGYKVTPGWRDRRIWQDVAQHLALTAVRVPEREQGVV